MAILKLWGQLLLRDKVKNTRSQIHTTLYCVWCHTAIMLLDNDHCKGREWGCWQSSMTPVSSWPAQTHTHTHKINAARCQTPRGIFTHRKVELLCLGTKRCRKTWLTNGVKSHVKFYNVLSMPLTISRMPVTKYVILTLKLWKVFT